LLNLEYEPQTWRLRKNGTREMIEAAYGAGPAYTEITNATTMMCTHCYDSPVMNLTSGTKWVNPSHVSLFQQIILTTGRPALAVQAHFTTLVQMVYYDRLPSFQASSRVHLDEYVQVTLPKGSVGFAAGRGTHAARGHCRRQVLLKRQVLDHRERVVLHAPGRHPHGGRTGRGGAQDRPLEGWQSHRKAVYEAQKA
jgi:hypothetical protein